LATEQKFYRSGEAYGRKENLLAFYGPLSATYAQDVTRATREWFEGSSSDADLLSVKKETVFSNDTTLLGIGVETNPIGYSVVVGVYL